MKELLAKYPQLSYQILTEDEVQKSILEKYWNGNINGKFSPSLKAIASEFEVTTDKLYHIAKEQSSVCWEFTCECGEVSKVKLNNRSSVYSCIIGEGALNTSKSIEDYQKCGKCKKKENEQKIRERFGETIREDNYKDYIDSITGKNKHAEGHHQEETRQSRCFEFCLKVVSERGKKRTFTSKPINLRKILTHRQWNLFEMIAREMDDGNMYVSIQPSENNGGRQL